MGDQFFIFVHCLETILKMGYDDVLVFHNLLNDLLVALQFLNLIVISSIINAPHLGLDLYFRSSMYCCTFISSSCCGLTVFRSSRQMYPVVEILLSAEDRFSVSVLYSFE